MSPVDIVPAERVPLTPAAVALAVGVVLIVFTVDPPVGSVLGMAAAALFALRARIWWLAATAAAWTAAFTMVLVFPGPYDSSAGPAAVPVLAGFVGCFLGGWVIGRKLQPARRSRPADAAADPAAPTAADSAVPTAAGSAVPAAVVDSAGPAAVNSAGPDDAAPTRRPLLVWPAERRLRLYLGLVFLIALASAVLRFRGTLPPVFADNPDAAREILSHRDNIYTGLLGQSWTVGLAVALLRTITGDARGRWFYITLSLAFAFGAALGASKNAVLVGIVPALLAALSVRRPPSRTRPAIRTPIVVAAIGAAAILLAVVLGGQRTLAGTGLFEDEFRARYGDSAIAASVASLDLSLSSSTETFGRLWQQRDAIPAGHGAYSVKFLGSPGEAVFGHTDLYLITSQLSMPYYMNTATFVAIPLLDFGPAGAVLYLALLGILVGLADRRLEFSTGPAQQLGRAFIVYYAAFGIYELYAAIQPFWLGLAPGLIVLYLTGRSRRAA